MNNKKLRRVKASDLETGRELLLQVILNAEAQEKSQRQAFGEIMPTIYMLRVYQKFTFREIASLLSEATELCLSISAVRAYYNLYVSENEPEYKKTLNEKIQFMEDIQKEYSGRNLTGIAQFVIDKLAQHEKSEGPLF